MTTTAIEFQGTLREDGTVLLDQKPNLPAGRVRVLVEPANSTEGAANDLVSVLARIHADQRMRGHTPLTAEEIDAYIAEMRDDDLTADNRLNSFTDLHVEILR